MPTYTVAGRTHPKVLEQHGDVYRDSLKQLAADLGVAGQVRWADAYLDQAALSRLIRSADVVLLPYDSTEQVTSGVLIESVGAGVPVVATEFPHAVELLADGPGLLVPHHDPAAMAAAIRHLLAEPESAGRRSGLTGGPTLRWPAVAARYQSLAARLLADRDPRHAVPERARMSAQALRLVPPPVRLADAPAPSWAHIARLSDDVGLLEHARHAIVRREHGYCVDDVSRGLLVASREPQPTARVAGLAERYLAFLTHAQGPDGAFRNRLGYDRRWLDEPSTGDWWGRALWGLGTAAARSTVPWIRQEALDAFRIGVAAAVAVVARDGLRRAGRRRGAARLPARPGGRRAARRRRHGDRRARRRTRGGPGPSSELTYANPALAEVIISAGDLLGDEHLLAEGLRMLAWLCVMQEHQGHLSTVPVGGWRPGVDQAPARPAADRGRRDRRRLRHRRGGDRRRALGRVAVPGDRVVPGRQRHRHRDARPADRWRI